jgi:hypothetical protein
LRQRFPAQYDASTKVFWEPGDPPLSAALRSGGAALDERAIFAHFREAAPVFPPAGVRTRCAVVGSSSNLLGSGLGAEIDAHDAVIRINLAPTRGFEADVGRRTTHYVVNHYVIEALLEDPRRTPPRAGNPRERLLSADRAAYWLLLYRPHEEPNESLEQLVAHVELLAGAPDIVPRDRSRLIHPGFTAQLEEFKLGSVKSLSSGLVGVLLALHVCDAADVFGFGPDRTGARGFYYKPETHGGHEADLEEVLLRRLAAASLITLRPELAVPGMP